MCGYMSNHPSTCWFLCKINVSIKAVCSNMISIISSKNLCRWWHTLLSRACCALFFFCMSHFCLLSIATAMLLPLLLHICVCVCYFFLVIASWCAQQLLNFQPRIIFTVRYQICVISHLFHYKYHFYELCEFIFGIWWYIWWSRKLYSTFIKGFIFIVDVQVIAIK